MPGQRHDLNKCTLQVFFAGALASGDAHGAPVAEAPAIR
jgi:hypothetical protein